MPGTEGGDLRRRNPREQLEVAPHHFVGDRHEFAEDVLRLLVDPDVVAIALGHLLHAVESFEEWDRQRDLRLLTVGTLEVAPDQQIERLVGAPELDIGGQRHRIVSLGDRVEELVQADRTLGGVPCGEVLALEHPGYRQARRFADDALEGQRREPRRVEVDTRARHVDHLAELRAVRVRVRANLVPGERLASLRAAGRIADHAGEVADDHDDLVAQILKVPELPQDDRMTQVKVGRGWIEPQLDPQRRAGASRSLELLGELGLHDDVDGTPPDDLQLRVDRGELHEAQNTGVVSHRF